MPAKLITTKPSQIDAVLHEYTIARSYRSWAVACKIRNANPDLEEQFNDIDEAE